VFSQKKKCKRKATNACSDASLEVHTRKPQQPNWEQGEIMALIKAKRDEHVVVLDKVDP
jgi:hypothetical protein